MAHSLHMLLSPGEEVLNACLGVAVPGDAVVLSDAAVVLLLSTRCNTPEGIRLLATRADVEARGLLSHAEHSDVELISDGQWVDLCTSHEQVLSWT